MAAPGEDPIHREPGMLLFGLAMLAFGGWGLATGVTIMFCPPGGTHSQGLWWKVTAPGARVAAVGMLAGGIGCIGHFWWQDRRKWPVKVLVTGIAIFAVGQVAAWIGQLV